VVIEDVEERVLPKHSQNPQGLYELIVKIGARARN
jgi:hypothetical protein